MMNRPEKSYHSFRN